MVGCCPWRSCRGAPSRVSSRTPPPLPPVPVYVMLPLDVIAPSHSHPPHSPGSIARAEVLRSHLRLLKSCGVSGVSIDVWWGLVEPQPTAYHWEAYRHLLGLVADCGLLAACIMSFHSCGGNVGDDVTIPLPSWVLSSPTRDLWFESPRGVQNREYISLWADDTPILLGDFHHHHGHDSKEAAAHPPHHSPGPRHFPHTVPPHPRTALECYRDFLASFLHAFSGLVRDGTISHVVLGAGPCGELRYPSYFPAAGWAYPGVGEFQCFAANARAGLRREADRRSRSGGGEDVCDWGSPPSPDSLGHMNSIPDHTEFFTAAPDHTAPAPAEASPPPPDSGPAATGTSDALLQQPAAACTFPLHFASPRGQFFLRWYSDALLRHAESLLKLGGAALAAMPRQAAHADPKLVLKVPGIHWWAGHPSRAAEATAGYGAPGAYTRLCSLLARHGAVLDFTCVEMRDAEEASSKPFSLVRELCLAARTAGVEMGVENALDVCGDSEAAGYFTVLEQRRWCGEQPWAGEGRAGGSLLWAALGSALQVVQLGCWLQWCRRVPRGPLPPPHPAWESFTFLRLSDRLLHGGGVGGQLLQRLATGNSPSSRGGAGPRGERRPRRRKGAGSHRTPGAPTPSPCASSSASLSSSEEGETAAAALGCALSGVEPSSPWALFVRFVAEMRSGE